MPPCRPAPALPQVQRLRDVLAMHTDQVHSLGSRKVHLQLALDERRQEIELHRDGLRGELRLIKDDMHRWGARAARHAVCASA